MSKIIIKISGAILLVMLTIGDSFSQCAMCRVTLENNVSNGEAGIAASINFGILYLLVMPYLLIGILAYFWYKKSKANAGKKSFKGFIQG